MNIHPGEILEKEESWKHFLKPVLISSIFFTVLMNSITILIVILDILFNIFGNDPITNNLILLNGANIIAVILIYFIFLPIFKIKKVEYSPQSGINYLKTFLILTMQAYQPSMAADQVRVKFWYWTKMLKLAQNSKF